MINQEKETYQEEIDKGKRHITHFFPSWTKGGYA
jgi:hypothetical protein